MKKRLQLTVIRVILLCFLFGACKKDGQDSQGETNDITLTIDGKEYTVKGIRNTTYTDKPIFYGGFIFRSDYNELNFSMSATSNHLPFLLQFNSAKGSSTGIGNYTISYGNYSEYLPTREDYTFTQGTATITKSGFKNLSDQYLEGSISFVAKNNNRTKTVTGRFIIRNGHP